MIYTQNKTIGEVFDILLNFCNDNNLIIKNLSLSYDNYLYDDGNECTPATHKEELDIQIDLTNEHTRQVIIDIEDISNIKDLIKDKMSLKGMTLDNIDISVKSIGSLTLQIIIEIGLLF